ncbi:Hep/Hag repeat protein [Veillonellaceae bacterium DNF00751]|uniref:Hep/Hag repeat protein n=1 Tax=Megasphaera lornae TaxID=1000568 RepID=A0ABP2L4I8_9FIRM|nr:adhesin [Megasphaera lornae]EGL40922.1 Hep/Hag repeat protein [Megasphaera lornae]KXB90985.1 Hep/Hag repeat protein [Veillonellaceae bacterium DNF00751]
MKTYRKLKSKKSVHWKAAAALAAAFCTLGLSGTMAAEVSNGGGHFVSVKAEGSSATQDKNYNNDGAVGAGSVAIGQGTESNGKNSVAIGRNAGKNKPADTSKTGAEKDKTQQEASVYIGVDSGLNSSASYLLAVGAQAGAQSIGVNNVYIGTNAGKNTQGDNNIILGVGRDIPKSPIGARRRTQTLETVKVENSVVLGYQAMAGVNDGVANMWKIRNAVTKDVIVFGTHALGNGTNTIAVGTNAKSLNSIAVGADSNSKKQSVALGEKARSMSEHSVAIGFDAYTNIDDGVALGSFSNAYRKANIGVTAQEYVQARTHKPAYDPAAQDGLYRQTAKELQLKKAFENADTALGDDPDNETKKAVWTNAQTLYYQQSAVWSATKGAVSVGCFANGITRQITDVAAGSYDTDAVNVAQLKALDKKYAGLLQGTVSAHSGQGSSTTAGTGSTSSTTDTTPHTTSEPTLPVPSQETMVKWKNISFGKGYKNIIKGAKATGENAVAIGNGAENSGIDGITIGRDAGIAAKGDANVYVGARAGMNIQGQENIILGEAPDKADLVRRKLDKSIVLGVKAQAGTPDSPNHASEKADTNLVVIGTSASGRGINTIAIGTLAKTLGNNSISLGTAAQADNSIAIGMKSVSNGNAVAIGAQAYSNGKNSVAFGTKAMAAMAKSVALGADSQAMREAGCEDATAVGYDPFTGKTHVQEQDASGIDPFVSTRAAVSVGAADQNVLRQIVGVAAGSEDTDAVNVAQLKALEKKMQASMTSTSSTPAVSVGKGPGITIGTEAMTKKDSGIAIGNNARSVIKGSIVIGDTALGRGENAVAIGANAQATWNGNVALGSEAVSDRPANKDRAAALGYDPLQEKAHVVQPANGDREADNADSGYISTRGAVSVGDADHNVFRQIINVAAGSYDTDAVNVRQLKDLGKRVDNIRTSMQGRMDQLTAHVNDLDTQSQSYSAGAAALAALHPAGDTSRTWNLSAAFGHAGNTNVMALGIYYRPNAQTLWSFGSSLGAKQNVINGSLSFAFGKSVHTNDMTKKVAELQAAVAKQKEELAAVKQLLVQYTSVMSSRK